MNNRFAGVIAVIFMSLCLAACGTKADAGTNETDINSSAENISEENDGKSEETASGEPSTEDAEDKSDDTAEKVEEATEEDEDYEVLETPELEGYNLLWADEFNGDTLNEDNWTREMRRAGWTNNELQEYKISDENVFVRNGKLVLKAIQTENEKGRTIYTSGKINSRKKQDFMYGKVIIRAKTPEGKGLWPAGWMMPTEEGRYGNWPRCGEIDIMEVLGHDVKTAYTTIHYGEPHAQQQGLYTIEGDDSFADSYHEYSVEWEPGEMRFYIDDHETLVCNDWFSANSVYEQDYPAPFDQPFYVQLNLAVGGNWPGNPDDSTDFDKAEFLVDYVRVYQKPEYDTNVTKPVFDAKEPCRDGNYINNSDFSDDSEDLTDDLDWKFLLAEGGKGQAVIKDNMIEITSEAEGSEAYSIQLVSLDIPFYKGNRYRVSFDAKALKDRSIISSITAPFADYMRYYPDTEFDITTDWKTYTYEFEMTENDDVRGRLEFNLGASGSLADVDITNVRVEVIK